MANNVYASELRYGTGLYTGEALRERTTNGRPKFNLTLNETERTDFHTWVTGRGVGGKNCLPQPADLLELAETMGYTMDTKDNVHELLRRLCSKLERNEEKLGKADLTYERPFRGNTTELAEAALQLWSKKKSGGKNKQPAMQQLKPTQTNEPRVVKSKTDSMKQTKPAKVHTETKRSKKHSPPKPPAASSNIQTQIDEKEAFLLGAVAEHEELMRRKQETQEALQAIVDAMERMGPVSD